MRRGWQGSRSSCERPFPGGPVRAAAHALAPPDPVARHALRLSGELDPRAHLRGRRGGRFGILLYTGSPDAEGTLGGLVQQARHIEEHLAVRRCGWQRSARTIRSAPSTRPGKSMEERWLHGAACHGCALVAETSCEMRNDYLDRALVVPVLGVPDAAFFSVSAMTDALLVLPAHLRRRLVERARGRAARGAVFRLRDRARTRESGRAAQDVVAALDALERWGLPGPLPPPGSGRSRHAADPPAARPRLVRARGSRPPRPRHAARVRGAARLRGAHVWASTYAFFDGPKAFEVLAARMDASARAPRHAAAEHPAQEGRYHDGLGTSCADSPIASGSRTGPGRAAAVYYDPRSLEPDGPTGVLHAKAVVADDEAVFVTSANLTEAALDRNIEIGLLVRDRALAPTVSSHFRALIDRDLLDWLPAAKLGTAASAISSARSFVTSPASWVPERGLRQAQDGEGEDLPAR